MSGRGICTCNVRAPLEDGPPEFDLPSCPGGLRALSRRRFHRGLLEAIGPPGSGEQTPDMDCIVPRRLPMLVKDVMTTPVETTGPDGSLQEAAKRMKALDVGPLPVCENDTLVGMITDRDITVRAVAEGYGAFMGKIRDVMT